MARVARIALVGCLLEAPGCTTWWGQQVERGNGGGGRSVAFQTFQSRVALVAQPDHHSPLPHHHLVTPPPLLPVADKLRRSSLGFLGRAKIRTLKMTIIIVLVFFVCSTPYYVMMVW